MTESGILFLQILYFSCRLKVKKELFDNKNYAIMRLLRDRLFKFETDVNWFEQEYIENIENKRKEDIGKGCPPKKDAEYNTHGIGKQQQIANSSSREDIIDYIHDDVLSIQKA